MGGRNCFVAAYTSFFVTIAYYKTSCNNVSTEYWVIIMSVWISTCNDTIPQTNGCHIIPNAVIGMLNAD